LTVWSNADEARSEAIRETLADGARAMSSTLRKAEKAARAGRKMGTKLREEMEGMGEEWEWEETEGETEGNGEDRLAYSLAFASLTNFETFPSQSRNLSGKLTSRVRHLSLIYRLRQLSGYPTLSSSFQLLPYM